MLGIFEKLAWGLMGLVVLATGTAFYLLGMPSTQPYIATSSRVLNNVSAEKEMSDDAKDKLADIRQATKTKDKEAAGGTKPAVKRREVMMGVNQALYERISTAADAWTEAQNAEGELKDGRWHISKFSENNLFEKAGFQENDEIESINMIPIVDLADSPSSGFSLHSAIKKEFERGIPIVVNLVRKGRPIQMILTKDGF